MKHVYLLVLAVCVGCLCDDTYFKDNGDEIRSRVQYEYVGNPDDDAVIERPCFVYDLNCIRQYFAKHSKCIIKNGAVPDTVHRSQAPTYFMHANVTTTPTNILIFGLNTTRIEEFYVNKVSNKVVFTIQVRNLRLVSPSVYFVFHRNSREPITALEEASVSLESIAFTAIIPNMNGLQMDQAEVTAYVEVVPTYYFGPIIADNPDTVVFQAAAELMADMATTGQEQMLGEAPFFPLTYIQHNICDFGLKVL